MSNIVIKCRFAVGSGNGLKQFISDNHAKGTVDTQWHLYNHTNMSADRDLAAEYSDKQFRDSHGIMDETETDESTGDFSKS